ncbi:hypothetical protein ABFX02_02G156500 [Erythranthe guttata]
MEVMAAKKVSVFHRMGAQPAKKSVVCRYWANGNCIKGDNCDYFHGERPPPQTGYVHYNQARSKTWTNTNSSCNPKYGNGSSLSKKGGKFSTASYQKPPRKVSTKSLTFVRSELEKNDTRKAPIKQCGDWVRGNCVRGDKCRYVHSWFSGSGFAMLAKLEGHAKGITGIALPSGCDKLYSCSKDKSIRAWDCNSGQLAGSVSTVGEVGCLINEGAWLFVGLPNVVKAWNIQNQAEFFVNAPGGLVCSLALDNDKLFAGMEDGTILVWKLNAESNTPELIAMLKEHHSAVCSLVVGANNRLYSGSKDSTIKVWDTYNLQCLHTLSGHTKDVTSLVCWDSYLISASLDKTLKVWSATESGTIKVDYEVKDDYEVNAMCGIHDAEGKPILLCAYSDNTVRLYELPSFTERGRIFSKGKVEVIEVGIDGLFFTGDANGDVSVWKMIGAPCMAES